MSEQLFDTFVRDKLKDYTSPVPEGLWAKIVADKEYNPKGFWRIANPALIAAAGIILLIGGYFIFNNLISTKTVEKQNSSMVSPINNSSQQKKLSNTTNSTLNSTSTEGKNDNPTDKNIKTNDIISGSSAIEIAKHKSVEYTSSSVKRDNSPFNASSKVQVNPAENSAPQLANPSGGLQMALTKKESSYGELIRLHPTNLYALNSLQTPPFNLRSILGLGNDCPSAYGNQRNDWFLEIYVSPDYNIKTLAANGLSSLYLQKKDSTEHMRLGYTIGARISKNVGDHFMLKAGLQYSQINEHFSQRKENETKTVTVIVSRTIVRPQGDTTFKDTTSVTQIGYAVKSSRNHYSNIEIPLSIGYEFGHEKDLWKVAVNGGAIFNITSWYTGETIDTALNVVSISDTKGSNGFYKKDIGLSLFGSLSLIRNINNKLDVFAEPYFRYSLSNLKSNIGYSQRFNTFGLMLGVRMKLNYRQHF
jgi:opacity protein-like surface antigen